LRTREVVALDAMSSSVNEPGEFVIAAVGRDGILQQRGGNDFTVSETLLAILKDLHTMSEQL